MHIVVIGGSGFLGRSLINYLLSLNTYTITNIDIKDYAFKNHNKKLNFIKSDVSSQKTIEKKFRQIQKKFGKQVAVFHFAGMGDRALCDKFPDKATFSNVTLSAFIIMACEKYGFKKFIFPSSGLVYAPLYGVHLSENDALLVNSVYTAVKIAAEKIIEGLSSTVDVQCFVVRISNVFGAESSKNTLFGRILEQVIKKQKFIHLLNLYPKNDFIYIEDVARAFHSIIRCPHSNKFSIYNISSGQVFSSLEITQKVCREAKLSKYYIRSISKEADRTNRILTNEKIFKELKWYPQYSIDAGIKDALKRLEYEK